jgi:hypothetical protein
LSEGGSEDIICERLDSYVRYASQTNYIKIDVEGHERCVIQGGQEFFGKTPQGSYVAMETSHKDVSKLLQEKGYREVDATATDKLLVKDDTK